MVRLSLELTRAVPLLLHILAELSAHPSPGAVLSGLGFTACAYI